jgi:hypothetical protein
VFSVKLYAELNGGNEGGGSGGTGGGRGGSDVEDVFVNSMIISTSEGVVTNSKIAVAIQKYRVARENLFILTDVNIFWGTCFFYFSC